MSVIERIQQEVASAIQALYGEGVLPSTVQVNTTRPEFEGEYTVVVFPYTRVAKKKPEQIGEELGAHLLAHMPEVGGVQVIKGFLNLSLTDDFWCGFLQKVANLPEWGCGEAKSETVLIEFSSPNTNKPLHLGHVRNILLGWSASKILKASGYRVINTQIVNDRGIAICRSMLAWQEFANGATPDSEGVKGDHFVGRYYVEFASRFETEYLEWQSSAEGKKVCASQKKGDQSDADFFKSFKNAYFNSHSRLGAMARDMLIRWEAGDPAVRSLWEQMNSWVYEGFDKTYGRLGVSFDKLYYESETYLLGKELIDGGVSKGVLRKDGKRVWVDLEDAGLGVKTIIKSDGTSTYTSQDVGTAHQRYKDFKAERMIYVVADEQNNHFDVLFEILSRLGEPYADGLFHLSYGMVDLPGGRMKSREGNVVDADDLMDEVAAAARKEAESLGSLGDLPAQEKKEIWRQIGMAALKFFILKVNPRKRMTFDPEESVELQGQTGPYIQYAYVRMRGVVERGAQEGVNLADASAYQKLEPAEKALLKSLMDYPGVISTAAQEYDPSHVAAWCYQVARQYSKFWHDLSIFGAASPGAVAFRLLLSRETSRSLRHAMDLLGIEMPSQM